MKRILYILNICVAFIVCGCAQISQKDSELIVGSFNILGGDATKSPHKQRAELAKKFVQYHEFDIIGVQEMFSSQATAIVPKEWSFTGLNVIGNKCGTSEKGFSPWEQWGNYIIYKKSRLALLDSGGFWLSPTPEKRSKGWDELQYRYCNWAKFRDKITEKTFFFFDTHFGLTVNSRLESAKLLVAKVAEIAGDSPFFITGDFNTRATETATLNELKRGGLLLNSREQSVKAPYGPENSFIGAMYDSFYRQKDIDSIKVFGKTRPDSAIDYIWVSKGIKVLDYAVLNDNVDLKYPSDHLPLRVSAIIE